MLIYLGENNITRIKFKRNKFLVKHDRIENRMLIVKKKNRTLCNQSRALFFQIYDIVALLYISFGAASLKSYEKYVKLVVSY